MTRIPRRRQHAPAACYHVLNRGHNRDAFFADDEDRASFLTLLARYRDRFGLRLHHYCLMGNHFHLLWQLDDPGRLSALMAGLLREEKEKKRGRESFSDISDPKRPRPLFFTRSIKLTPRAGARAGGATGNALLPHPQGRDF